MYICYHFFERGDICVQKFFYADLDMINSKGVLITGHGKGIVNKNPHISGEYIAPDMVRLIAIKNELYG